MWSGRRGAVAGGPAQKDSAEEVALASCLSVGRAPEETAVWAVNRAGRLTCWRNSGRLTEVEVQGWGVAGPPKDLGYHFWVNQGLRLCRTSRRLGQP